MQRVQAVPERLIRVRIQVAMAVEGETDRGVPGPSGDLLGIRPGRNPQRHRRMPQVVDAQPIQPGRPSCRPPDAMPETGSPSFRQLALAWAMAGSTLAARKDTPERSAIVQGWATSPVTLTGAPCRMPAKGTPGTLTASRSALSSP
jgi:hypothetical protein